MELHGVGVGRGVAIGPVMRMPDPLPEPADVPREGASESEIERTLQALKDVAGDLQKRGQAAGGNAREVLEAQALMAEDPSLIDDVSDRIRAGKTGERAVFEAFGSFADILIGMGGYMAERASDLGDVAQRIVAVLTGAQAPGIPTSDRPFVLVAHDLAPADTALLELDKVLALITRDGGPTSHTAILARSKSIPAIVGVVGADGLLEGAEVIADAESGRVLLDPSAADLEAARERIAARAAEAQRPLTAGALSDGTPILLLANLGSADQAAEAVDLGAEGVGLFRTEFLFLDAKTAPTVDEQKVHYSRLFEAFPGKKVVVRVLDAGADKPLAFLNNEEEENPALGLRGLRALRAHEEILRAQLTALAEAAASTDAEVWVMAPMVSDASDSEYFTSLAKELGLATAGVMVEVPSSALLAEQIFESADFVSIGTNDLTQYTLAADRLLGSVASLQDPWHPAVLRLVAEVGRAGKAVGKPVGICGEAAADPLLAVVLVGLGATSLSMTPAALADVRAELGRYSLAEAQDLAERALSASSGAGARAAAASAIALSTESITANK